MAFMRHLLVAALVSYGFSIFFWVAHGMFILKGFIVVSAICALAGAAIGFFTGNKIFMTVIATAVIRMGAYYAVVNGLLQP
jgi:hypothetical protein